MSGHIYDAPVPDDSDRAELAALAATLDACRERITDLARRRAASRADDGGDDLLALIFEAERGVVAAQRLVERAARA
jgi:hypothetical protein